MNEPHFSNLPKRPELSPLLKTVESMGCSCELGVVQRHCKAEPLSLLRFAYTPLPGLIAALRAGFAGIGEPQAYKLRAGKMGQWIAQHQRYEIEFHGTQLVDKMPEAQAREAMVTHVRFLAEVFIENLREGKKLFVYRPATPGPAPEQRRELLAAMRRYGKAPLMWMDFPEDKTKIGTAEWVEKGQLIAGYIDRFPAPTPNVSIDIWLSVVQAADALRRSHAGVMEPMRRRA